MTKLSIIGSGNLGSQAGFYAALKGISEIVLFDIVEGMPQGKALDMMEAMPLDGSSSKISGTNDYLDTKDSDVVIVTAGLPRKPGMTREDLIEINTKIMKSVIPGVVENSPNCKIIIVSNPVDAMVYLAYKLSGFPKQRIIGMAGVLDSARFRAFIAMETGSNDVEAIVLGSHGDLMVPLIGHCKVDGKPLSEVLTKEKIDVIVQRTRKAGGEIVQLLKTGSAFFAPGMSAAEMAISIINDEKKILSCLAMLEGEYGVNGLFVGVPVKLGKEGVEEIIKIELTEEEKAAFENSVNHIKKVVEKLE